MKTLDIKMQENDAGANTIREYLKALLNKLWEEGEGFSGKRPFGNSGWEFDLITALVTAEAIGGTLDEEGCVVTCDIRAARLTIFKAIKELK